MKIGIAIAVVRELKAFLESDFDITIIKEDNREVYKTIINGNEIYATRLGAGLIESAASCQYLITKYNVDLIINYGVTGALDKDLKVADLFVVNKVCNYDFDTSAVDNVKYCQYEDYDDIYIPMNKEMIDLAKSIKPDLKDAIVASGNRFVANTEEKMFFNTQYKCNICDMEIASLARICDLNKVKILSIKSISDVLDGDGKDFAINIQNSAKVAFAFVKELLYKL